MKEKILFSILVVFLLCCKKEDDQSGYNCSSGNCVEVQGGIYTNYENCMAACNNNNNNNNNNSIGYNCIEGNCVQENSGTYSTLAGCLSVCSNNNGNGSGSGSGSGSSVSYNCLNESCVDPLDGTGIYSNINDCLDNCSNSNGCSNSFTINNTNEKSLGIGPSEIINFGNIWQNGTTNFEIRMFTADVSGNANGPSYSGYGDMIILELHSNGTPDGTYSFYSYDFFPNNPPINTCTPKYLINQNMSSYSNKMVFPNDATSSNLISVTNNGGNNYTVEFEFNSTDGTFEGCYSGPLTYWNTSGGSGSGSGSGSGLYLFDNNYVNPKTW